MFNLYNGFDKEDTAKIFRKFPYVAATDHRKVTLFCGEFKKYKMDKEQIIKLCTKSGGLLGSSVSNFRGVFDSLRQYGLDASEVKQILDVLPEFVMQNRMDMLGKKLRIISFEGGRTN